MIYCITIQDEAGAVVGSATFDLHRDGIDCEGYKLCGQSYPACSVWQFLEHIGSLIDVDKLSPKSRDRIEELATYTKP